MSGIFDKSSFFLASIALLLAFLSYQKTGEAPWVPAGRAGSLIVIILPKLILGMFIGALIADILPREILQSWLSDRSGWRGILIGWLAGSCSPWARLRPLSARGQSDTGGAGFGPMITMLTASALIGPVRAFAYEIPILGTEFFTIRVISVFWIPPLAGVVAQTVVRVIKGAKRFVRGLRWANLSCRPTPSRSRDSF